MTSYLERLLSSRAIGAEWIARFKLTCIFSTHIARRPFMAKGGKAFMKAIPPGYSRKPKRGSWEVFKFDQNWPKAHQKSPVFKNENPHEPVGARELLQVLTSSRRCEFTLRENL